MLKFKEIITNDSFSVRINQRERTLKKAKNYHNRPFFNATFAALDDSSSTSGSIYHR